jgi:hypothetical protein
MAVDVAVVLVVAILSTEHSGTGGASEMLYVIFPVEGSDVGAPQRIPARKTDEIQATEVIPFTEGVLVWAFVRHRKEL